MQTGFGINFLTGEDVNMVDSGIIDPVKVTNVPTNAVSAAGTLITTSHELLSTKTAFLLFTLECKFAFRGESKCQKIN